MPHVDGGRPPVRGRPGWLELSEAPHGGEDAGANLDVHVPLGADVGQDARLDQIPDLAFGRGRGRVEQLGHQVRDGSAVVPELGVEAVGRQRSALFALPQREADLLRHYTLSDEDLQNIGARRRPRNKLGFALQLCVLRYPGRLLVPAEFVPPAVVDFIGRQLDLDGDDLADYAVRSETRHEHLAELRRLYGFRSFSGGAARELGDRLREEAPQAQSNEDLVRRFVEACRRTRTILPATTTIERLCGDALVDAERRIEARIAERVPPGLWRDLEHLLEETVDAGVTRFVWLRQFEPGSNSAAANRLLDRLEHLRRLDVPEGLFHDIPPHRITRLRRQGERYFADGLRELPDNRRLAILAVCAVEWEMFLADAVVETHDRIVGRTYREAARTCESAARGRDGRGPRGAPGIR